MSEETQTLRLFKYNVTADGNQPFSINISLNDNWDKIDSFAESTNNSKQDKSNLVTSLSPESTDSQYPSAKCIYDIIGDVETLLSEI